MAAGSGAGVHLEQLKAKGVIPDVVEDVGSPLLDMRVGYNEIEFTNGVAIRVKQTQGKPYVELRGNGFGNAEDKFTLLMVDPDAPGPEAPSNRNWHRLLSTFLALSPLLKWEMHAEIWDKGYEAVPYIPAPPARVHRYVFLLFKQEKFMVADFAKQQNLGIPATSQPNMVMSLTILTTNLVET